MAPMLRFIFKLTFLLGCVFVCSNNAKEKVPPIKPDIPTGMALRITQS